MASKYSSYVKDARPDAPDLRDRMYEPRLSPMSRPLVPPEGLEILDQGQEGACTGFGLAAVINHLYQLRGEPTRVSARMLYEMAKRYDEWEGHDYEGSSCRGAIKGWYNMGVCTETSWPSTTKSRKAYVTVERAKEARNYTIGAYYRLRPNVVDFHSALNESHVIYVSASVHAGWDNPKAGKIAYRKTTDGGHAFALVGYNDEGFWVQNSWGKDWGNNGLALWTYEDWAQNITDAWVVQLALPTPQIFDFTVSGNSGQTGAESKKKGLAFRKVSRSDICGHFVHLDDGYYHDSGPYWSNGNDVAETAELLQASDKYDHVLFYAHGGLNSPDASANRIAAMKKVFLANRIYPYHFMYDTGVMEEIKDVLFGKKTDLTARMGGFSDWWDRSVENLTRRSGRALWNEMKRGARNPFGKSNTDGSDAIKKMINAVKANKNSVKIHVAGHSTGGILMAYLLDRWFQEQDIKKVKVQSCSLLAPAATVALYQSHYAPLLKNGFISNMRVYNLNEKLEEDDNVIQIYRKSLLWLVSRAFEEREDDVEKVPLLGMEVFSREIDIGALPIEFVYSKGNVDDRKAVTRSTSHGGFDNDPDTMNDILRRILGKKPAVQFNKQDLDY
ncbi:MAG: peptidase C1 [Gammaproteobacteria bacterium]|nr:peptidase C1 [Gammaproteobacteria bacterium]